MVWMIIIRMKLGNNMSLLRVLGIETSCDETAVALVREDRTILAHKIYSQIDDHLRFGGVVPELAARAHLARLPELVRATLEESQLSLKDVDAIAVTAGPGLLGGVIIGVMVAKAMAVALNKPIIAVNHLEAHALTVRLVEDVPFPYMLLMVSGGHTQLLWVRGVGSYELLGTTLDDAVGEAFDKTARLLDLPYPGGPNIEREARAGNPESFAFPRPLLGDKSCNFSLSGLKTAVRQCVNVLPAPLSDDDKRDVAASFQAAVGDILVDRCRNAFKKHAEKAPYPFVVAGGVASNVFLRQELESLAEENGLLFKAPPLTLCTDNGAMIAWAGIERLRLGDYDALDFTPLPRWPLDTVKNLALHV
jgi:N6-L-threonylcarbamoyladenine synthase